MWRASVIRRALGSTDFPRNQVVRDRLLISPRAVCGLLRLIFVLNLSVGECDRLSRQVAAATAEAHIRNDDLFHDYFEIQDSVIGLPVGSIGRKSSFGDLLAAPAIFQQVVGRRV